MSVVSAFQKVIAKVDVEVVGVWLVGVWLVGVWEVLGCRAESLLRPPQDLVTEHPTASGCGSS